MRMRGAFAEAKTETEFAAYHFNVPDPPITSRIPTHAFQKIG